MDVYYKVVSDDVAILCCALRNSIDGVAFHVFQRRARMWRDRLLGHRDSYVAVHTPNVGDDMILRTLVLCGAHSSVYTLVKGWCRIAAREAGITVTLMTDHHGETRLAPLNVSA